MKQTDICDATREAFNTKGMSKTFKEEFAKRYGSGFLKKDYEQFDYLKKGGIDKNTGAMPTEYDKYFHIRKLYANFI